MGIVPICIKRKQNKSKSNEREFKSWSAAEGATLVGLEFKRGSAESSSTSGLGWARGREFGMT
jgi:hypothetical protein